MLNGKATRIVMICCSLLFFDLSWAISKEMHAMVRLETHSNAVALRDSNFVALDHYEIPLDILEANIASRTNTQFVESMIFERNGEKYVRWVINPEDTKWHKDVESFLRNHNIEAVRKKHFMGYMTASRSYIAVDPNTGAEFSVKVSTDKTGGNWRDKKQTLEDAQQIRMISDFVHDQLKNQPRLQNIVLADEPMIFGIKDLDQGMVIRSYELLTKSKKRYVPGFAIMNEKTGRELAKANGSDDPASYWNEHYNKPLARALAEFFALTGMAYDSPHSQNFLVELDEHNRPTGKIVLRDFGDTYLSTDFFKAIGREDIVTHWEQRNLRTGKMGISVCILFGSKAPNWINVFGNNKNPKNYNKWGRDFFDEFEAEFTRQTGVALKTDKFLPDRRDLYFSKSYFMDDQAGKSFLELATQNKNRNNLVVRTCGKVFLAM